MLPPATQLMSLRLIRVGTGGWLGYLITSRLLCDSPSFHLGPPGSFAVDILQQPVEPVVFFGFLVYQWPHGLTTVDGWVHGCMDGCVTSAQSKGGKQHHPGVVSPEKVSQTHFQRHCYNPDTGIPAIARSQRSCSI